MIKKSSTIPQARTFPDSKVAPGRKKRLEIKQIRSFVDQLLNLPDDAPMPDWRELSVGDRFAIVVRLIPQENRANVLGKSAVHVRRYEQGTDIPLTVVAALAAETEVPLDWIVSGEAMPRRSDEGTIRALSEAAAAYASDSEDVPVQRLAFKVAAGRGEVIMDEAADRIRFPRMILQSAGVAPQNARLMEARGESMRATINDGDLMLVDVSPSAVQIVEGKIYVFAIGDEAYVKRLRRTAGSVVMISDNREMFPPEAVPKEAALRIFGRVMWAGRSL
jgi:phage repressor protein C with HTH and peptisase S24 domain